MDTIRRFTIEQGFRLNEEVNEDGIIVREFLFNFADASLHDYRYEYNHAGVRTGDVVSIVSGENTFFGSTQLGGNGDYLVEGHMTSASPPEKVRFH